MRLRPARPADREALLAISLATGDAGGDAARLYRDGDLIGLIYSAPYLALEPDLAPVAQDGDGVAGFAVGTADTPAFEARLERDWWPPLRAAHPAHEGDPAAWTADERRIARFHAPRLTPTAVTARRPAHLHLNLLPRAQGRGLGRRLVQTWLARLAELPAPPGEGRPEVGVGVHVGVGPANARALRFWRACGFEPLEDPERAARAGVVWMCRDADEPAGGVLGRAAP